MKSYDAIGFGINAVDFLFRLPPGYTQGHKYEIKNLMVQGGGPASNGVSVLGKLGFKSGFITKLGQNAFSDISRRDFAAHGVDSDLLTGSAGARPAVSMIQIDPETGERTICYNLEEYEKVAPQEIPEAQILKSRVVIVDSYDVEGAERLLEIASKGKIPSVLDIETNDESVAKRLMRFASDTILPFASASHLTHEEEPSKILKKLQQFTSQTVVITDGGRGAWGIEKEEAVHVPAFKIKPVDTTGCGDSYHGAYAAAILMGLPFRERLEFASYIAGKVALAIGGRTNLPTRQQVLNEDVFPLSATLKDQLKKALS